MDIRINVAEHAVAGAGDTLVTIGLGSCVAIMLYEPETCIGGLAHVLLPDESMARERTNPAKFSSTAVPLLVQEMLCRGADRGNIVAKLVGGASMFASLLPAGGINIGERNVQAARRALEAASIPLLAEEVGRDHGRSVYFRLDDGSVEVRSLKRGNRVL
jgi:chemotaxis protein CheD